MLKIIFRGHGLRPSSLLYCQEFNWRLELHAEFIKPWWTFYMGKIRYWPWKEMILFCHLVVFFVSSCPWFLNSSSVTNTNHSQQRKAFFLFSSVVNFLCIGQQIGVKAKISEGGFPVPILWVSISDLALHWLWVKWASLSVLTILSYGRRKNKPQWVVVPVCLLSHHERDRETRRRGSSLWWTCEMAPRFMNIEMSWRKREDPESYSKRIL